MDSGSRSNLLLPRSLKSSLGGKGSSPCKSNVRNNSDYGAFRRDVPAHLPKEQLRALAPRKMTRAERQNQVLIATSTAALSMIQEHRLGGSSRKRYTTISVDRPCNNTRSSGAGEHANQVYYWNKAYMQCLFAANNRGHKSISTNGSFSSMAQQKFSGMPDGDSSDNSMEKASLIQYKAEHQPCDVNTVDINQHANRNKEESQATGFHSTVQPVSNQKQTCERSSVFPQSDSPSGSTDSRDSHSNRSPDRLEARLVVEQPVLIEDDLWDSEMHFSPESKVVHTDANLELLERNLLPSGRSSLNIDPDGIPPNKLITGSAVDHVTNNQAHLTNKLDKHPNPTSHCDPISAEQALGLTRASQQHSELLEYNDTSDTLEAPQIDNGDQLDSCHCHHQLHLDAKDELRKSIEIAYCILDELVTTERSYCRSLYVFSEIVAKNMCTKSGVSLKELRLLFPRCLPDLYAMHVEMLEQMEAYMRVNDKKNGHQYEFDCSRPPFIVLLELLEQKSRKQIHTLDRTTDEEPNEARFFVLYKRYFSEFTVAMETMRKLTRQSSRFRQTVKRLQDHPDCEGFDFSAFLLAPVQRLPRYLLLMKQLTRHLRKIAQNPSRIGQTHVGTVLDMSERCEKQLHSVLVYLDSQLAEHRQNSKQKSETSVQETICGSGETGTELTSANGTQSRLNPSQLIENGYENFRSLWPRVRRAFSDKRNVATSEVSPQDESLQEQKPEQRFLSCHTATAHVEPDVVHHSQCQSYGNAVPVGRFLVAHQSEDDIFQPSDAHGTTPRSRMEKLILMDNPVQERVSCVKAGTISAAVRRNSRRQTVGEVTLAMQKAFSNNKLKRLSLDRQQLPFTQHINELSNSCVTFCDLSAEQKEPEKVMIPQSVSSVRAGSFKIAEQSRIKIDDDVKSITRKEVENPPQTEMKVNRVNTFPARQFPSLGLQRRQSEPCQAQTTQDYKKQQTIQETKLPGSQLKITAGLGKTRSVGIGSSSTFSTTSSSSTKSVPSEQTDLYRIRRRSNRLIEKSVTETARSEEIVLSRTAASAIKPSCTASKENSIGCFTCHPNVLPRDTRKPADKRSQAEVEGAVTMIKSCSKTLLGTSAPESSNTLQKKRVTSNWRSALKNLFRRKTNYKGDCSQSQVRKAQNIESSTWNSPHSVAVTPSDVGLSGTISESPSITIDTLNNLSGSMMKSDFLHTDEHIVIHESQMIADPPEIADDQKEYLSELGDLVFLDETGNPCFDI